ncbi:hypothetical protein [Amnibacterium endophyticum]|uniref:Uncharacterized protein n=1 Tax=Amnibacterium endophyticum TaxID=2109337 RepID=A0ABW4LDT8_9MICO
MTTFRADGSTRAFEAGIDALRPGLLVRLQDRRARRRAQREFDAVLRAFRHGRSLPSSVRSGAA